MSDYKTKFVSVVVSIARCRYHEDFQEAVAVFEDNADAEKYVDTHQTCANPLLIVEEGVDFYPQEKKREPSENS